MTDYRMIMAGIGTLCGLGFAGSLSPTVDGSRPSGY